MSTWFRIVSVKVPPGAAFPCPGEGAVHSPIRDAARFVDRIGSWSGASVCGDLEAGPPCSLLRGNDCVGQISLLRDVSLEFLRAEILRGAREGLPPLERLGRALEGIAAFPVLGVSLRADPRDVLDMYRHLKAEFPDLLVSWDEARAYFDEESFLRQIEAWERGSEP